MQSSRVHCACDMTCACEHDFFCEMTKTMQVAKRELRLSLQPHAKKCLRV